MKRFFLIAAIYGVCAQDQLAEVKDSWISFANRNVYAETSRLLQGYGLSLRELKDHACVFSEQCKKEHDKKWLFLKKCYHLGIPPRGLWGLAVAYDKFGILTALKWSGLLGGHHKNVIEQQDDITRLAQKIFDEDQIKVDIAHCGDNQPGDIGVVADQASQHAVLYLNATAEQKNPAIEDILRHEFAHIFFGDALFKNILWTYIGAHSQEPFRVIQQKSHLLAQALEQRADIYAAIHSDDYGQKLINFFENHEDAGEGQATHPLASKRVELLRDVRNDLLAASAE